MAVTDLVHVLERRLGQHVAVDDWRPAVQGAVGHVVGVSSGANAYVAKVFASTARRQASREVRALRLAERATGVPVPRVVLHDRLPRDGGCVVLMTRLPGVRWADRRRDLDGGRHHDLVSSVAGVLRGLHAVAGTGVGDLLDSAPGRTAAWERLHRRLDVLLREYLAQEGRSDVAEQIDRFVTARRHLFGPHVRPVLCHHDLNDGNVLVSAAGAPVVTGVVDFERASWDDPVADVALTALHVRHHDPAAVETLLGAYGLRDEDRDRLDVHVVVLALAERAWVAYDRPRGWRLSIAALDELLVAST